MFSSAKDRKIQLLEEQVTLLKNEIKVLEDVIYAYKDVEVADKKYNANLSEMLDKAFEKFDKLNSVYTRQLEIAETKSTQYKQVIKNLLDLHTIAMTYYIAVQNEGIEWADEEKKLAGDDLRDYDFALRGLPDQEGHLSKAIEFSLAHFITKEIVAEYNKQEEA